MAKETAFGLLCEKLSSLFPGAIVGFEKGGELVVRMGVTADESGDLIPFKSSLCAPTTAKDIKRAWGGRRALRRKARP